MFCSKCGSPSQPSDKFCYKCGAALELPRRSATTSTLKRVPLNRYPFLRRRQGEAEDAIRCSNVIVEREFNSDVTLNFFIRGIGGSYQPPQHVRHKIPVMLVTDKRLVFLQPPLQDAGAHGARHLFGQDARISASNNGDRLAAPSMGKSTRSRNG